MSRACYRPVAAAVVACLLLSTAELAPLAGCAFADPVPSLGTAAVFGHEFSVAGIAMTGAVPPPLHIGQCEPLTARGHGGIEERRRLQREFRDRLARDPDDLAVRSRLAEVLAARGFRHEALRHIGHVLMTDPDRAEDWLRRSRWERALWLTEGEPQLLAASLASLLGMARAGIDATQPNLHAHALPEALSLAVVLDDAAALDELALTTPAAALAGDLDWSALQLAAPGLLAAAHDGDTAPSAADRLRRFWKSLDPTPTTSVNEAFLQHCYRVVAAAVLFVDADRPGWETAAGQRFIRYGSHQVQLARGTRRPATAPEVAWNYMYGRGLGYRDDAAPEDDQVSSLPNDQLIILDGKLPYLHTRSLPGGPVLFSQSLTLFRGVHSDARLSLSAAIPATEFETPGGPIRDDWSEIEVRWALFATDWRAIATRMMRIDDPTCIQIDAAGRKFLIARADFDVPAGSYIVATECTDGRTGRAGADRRQLEVAAPGGLLSGVELCRFVRRQDPGGGRRFQRYDAEVIPNPSASLAPGEPLRFYFEVYGLDRDPRGQRDCRLHYAVRSLGGALGTGLVHPLNVQVDIREPVARYDTIMPRVGALNADALPPGDYELTVEVEDRLSGDVDRVSIPFEKIAASPRI